MRCALFVAWSLAFAPAPALAIDAPVVHGVLVVGGQQYALTHVQAVRSPHHPGRAWVVLATEEIAVKDAANPGRARALARKELLHGVRIDVDSVKPDATAVRGALLMAPSGEIAFDMRGTRVWERLITANRRVVGTLRLARPAQGDVPAWSIDVSFSAPVYRYR